MANEEHLKILQEGIAAWNKWRDEHPEIQPDLTEADLRCKILDDERLYDPTLEIDLNDPTLIRIDLHNATLKGIDLTHACLHKADLRRADLSDARLIGTNFCWAKLRDANLNGADLHRANLNHADLTRAKLRGANLERAILVSTTVSRATFTGCRVYGASVWDLKGTPKDESGLVVTPKNEPSVTISDLEVAQFVYLLLNNAKIRDVIDTVTAKAVLILGRFIDERKQILDAIRDRLSAGDYVPIIFDFDKPASRDLTETISTLAHLCRFIIADVTDPKSIPQELMKIIPQLPSVPVQPILLEGNDEWSMFDDLKRTGRILPTFHYENLEDVRRSLRESILAPAEKWLEQFSKVRDPLQEIERLREELRQLKAGGDVANPTISRGAPPG